MSAPHLAIESGSWEGSLGERAKAVRLTVFVEEQGYPLDGELDEFDPVATHFLALDADGQVVATGRLFADQSDPEVAHIGRMSVRREARGAGVGRRVLLAMIEEARAQGFARIVLSSQEPAIGFYERAGFRLTARPSYMDGHIPHRDMELSLR
ncbi:MAG: GNAT family N-acetyltransferase [Sumerlaeia bacterium]